jgi:glycosyltransferase involved in cell wall biosynthesis
MIRELKSRGKPRIWIVAPQPPPYGGMSLQAEKLAQKLAAEGLPVDLIPTNPLPPAALRCVDRVPALRTIVREIQYFYSLRVILHDYGIVHHFSASYLYFALHTIPLLLFCKWSRNRLLLNYRGGKADEFLSVWSWLVAPLLRAANQVVVPSEYLQRVFARYGVPCSVLPNIADTGLFPFKERARISARLFVSRHLEPMYDIECVLRAFRRIQERVSDATLGIAGDGIEMRRLQTLARQWGLRGVTFYGAVPYRELPSLYNQYDIYLNGSRVDNFPGALIEAACSGLPVVTTRAGGIGEMIRHRENGLLVDVGDDKALANGALELIERSEFAREMARSARSWAEQFSWSSVFPELMAAYGITRAGEGMEAHSGRLLAQQ